ncbi:diaminopimelate epimerase [Mariniphaga anaerophila]|uniref:Diaminopimelate epimerase n=1 Tax=Mariniphaga anaerophila TaxID=1484053 RepID=A0A1M5CMS9_9BACT|nr:diaminopimelate epimerase [Mariniphaga anaerophila]SHF56001.1 diaminopimelate epimerase [Mariniphaga anaerophila]
MHNFFVKSHGLGNDYIVLNQDEIGFELTEDAIRRICDVHFGIGSDGILLKVPTFHANFGLRILNPDGSEAEKSGNGLRIFAKYLHDYQFAKSRKFTIETPGGLVQAEIIKEKNGKAKTVRVDMGKAIFSSTKIPVNCEKEECIDETLHLEYRDYPVNCVSMGNPHCVIFTENLDEKEVKTFGPQIETNPFFPNRINVQFVKVISPTEVEAMIWERGAGWTLASGSSSCAVAAVAVKKGLVQKCLTVKMPGGSLQIETDEHWNMRMTGEVSEIASGVLSRELLAELS